MADTPNQEQKNDGGGVPVVLVPLLLPIAIVGRRAIGSNARARVDLAEHPRPPRVAARHCRRGAEEQRQQ